MPVSQVLRKLPKSYYPENKILRSPRLPRRERTHPWNAKPNFSLPHSLRKSPQTHNAQNTIISLNKKGVLVSEVMSSAQDAKAKGP